MTVFKVMFTAILVANNVRDIDTDRATGKRTLAVLLGRDRTRRLYALLMLGPFALIAIFALAAWAPRFSLVALLAVPLAVPPVRTVFRETAGPVLIGALKATARIHLLVGALLAVGVTLALVGDLFLLPALLGRSGRTLAGTGPKPPPPAL